jgi:hypothetical protein
MDVQKEGPTKWNTPIGWESQIGPQRPLNEDPKPIQTNLRRNLHEIICEGNLVGLDKKLN